MTEANSIAPPPFMDEFKNIRPEIADAFILKANGKIEALNESKNASRAKKSIFSFNEDKERGEIISGINTLTFQRIDNQLKVLSISKGCLATISTRLANPKEARSLTTAVVPTVAKLFDHLASEISEPVVK